MKQPICPVCQGSGTRLWSREVCPNCEGSGKMPIVEETGSSYPEGTPRVSSLQTVGGVAGGPEGQPPVVSLRRVRKRGMRMSSSCC